MSMLQYPLYDFLATVPNCVETTTLAVVLEMFCEDRRDSKGLLPKADRLVVVNKQQYPIGMLYSARLIPQLLAAERGKESPQILDLQQPLSTLVPTLIEPIQILPASDDLEQFSLFCLEQQSQTLTHLDWALIDSNDKFLGLIDSPRLLQFLAKQKLTSFSSRGNGQTNKRGRNAAKNQTAARGKNQRQIHQPLVQLLERLPWPLMLQTSSGEIVTQNPAWWEQLGALKDPEGVRQQVQAILAPKVALSPEYPEEKAVKVYPDGSQLQPTTIKLHPGENTLSFLTEVAGQVPSTLPDLNHFEHQVSTKTAGGNHCFLDSDLETCTCVLQVQNGQERVWRFAKIRLDSPELNTLIPSEQATCSKDLWLLLATDVTEQQQLCKELAAKNADLIQLNRLKDEFLACISHELKTPLTAVLGLSRLLVDRHLGELNERQARYAGLIHQSGRHLMSVVNDILDLTRMETGQMDLMPSPVKIRAVCDRAFTDAKAIHSQTTKAAVNSQTPATQGQDRQFTITIETGLEEIIADELRLRQMLVHLLSNALKFTETDGEIGLRVSRWEGWIAFTVWDTGIGIPEHQQHLIFQKFQQLENPLTRQFEGTGLGLVLTRALARLHGGDVSFLSREGKGSQFTLLLPPSPPKTNFSEAEMGRIPEEEIPAPSRRKSKKIAPETPKPNNTASVNYQPASSQRLVLVVEAVARYIEDLTEQLKGNGYRVVIARSGTEAVEKARRLQPKAIFLNPLLPLLSGWDVLTLLKSDVATRHIPVIVTATGAEKEQAFANRAEGFLSLPVQSQVLTPLLEKLCSPPQNHTRRKLGDRVSTPNNTPLRILRLVNHQVESVNPHPSLGQHRVIEVDDLDQAELLARVWQFDVILLDSEIKAASVYLQQLIQYPRLAALPLVTCDATITQEASQMSELSVFPCLTPLGVDHNNRTDKTDTLLSVLQIASGIACPPSILVVDLTMLPDLPGGKHKLARNSTPTTLNPGEPPCSSIWLKPHEISRGSEWFQALVQYLQTAGLKAAMGRCWAEVLQQIRHQSVDLLLICLGDPSIEKEVLKALSALRQLPLDLPPILVLDQRLSSTQVPSESEIGQNETSMETVVNAIASQVLPRSISMEDLLNHINEALVKM